MLAKTRRLFRPTLAGVFLAALVVGPTPALPAPLDAAARADRQFERTGMVGKFSPAILPAGADPNQVVTVIVELNGAPVGTGGNAAQVKLQQDALKSAIAAQGGTVKREYQHALNGFAVDIARGNAANLTRLAGVQAVKATRTYLPDNAQSVPFIGAPTVWNGVDGVTGQGAKIAIIDTGIDYTHANFGGPGTAAAYQAAHAAEAAPADPTLFGPNARTKVKGGTDLVGDRYDASSSDPARRTPHPDPNPLDCNGHGSHVGGTAAGFGVTDSGATYTGPYDLTTPSRNFRIGPGVAPQADLYAVRVFGCEGSASSDVIIAAIDWVVKNKMDVANMSLGSSFGTGSVDDAEIDATDNAVNAGVMMIVSAGNSGSAPYIVGRPSTATNALSVAAIDSKPNFPGAVLGLSTGQSVTAINANGAALPGGSIPLMVLRDSGGNVSLGCSDADYPASVAGKAVVTRRGVCARVDRATLAQKHGAVAAIMINTDSGYPPFEGVIQGVTIPFLGVRGTLSNPTSDGSKVVAAGGGSTTMTAATVQNPGFRGLASFTSGGPRFDDSFLKPEVSAPGVSIISTAVGTGNQSEGLSGTSMAAPHVTGLAALALKSHPDWWRALELKQAIVNTASPGDVAGYRVRLAGAGLVSAPNAARTNAVAFGGNFDSSLSFGFDQDMRDLHERSSLLVRNHGAADVTFDVSTEVSQGRPHALSFERSTLSVPAGGEVTIDVRLDVPVASIGDSTAFRDVGGIVKLTPRAGGNNGISLRVPYYLVARALSDVRARLQGELTADSSTANVRLTNPRGGIAGTADFYSWGQFSGTWDDGEPYQPRATGVQSATSGGEKVVVFAINTRGRIPNAAPYEFDALVQNESGQLFDVFSVDLGLVTAGSVSGRAATFVANLQTNELFVDFFTVAPFNTSTIEMPVLASRLGLTPAAPRFDYITGGFDAFSNNSSVLDEVGSFNAFTNTISTGMDETVPVGGTRDVAVTLNAAEAQRTPSKGIMVVSLDNSSDRAAQVETIPVDQPAPPASAAAPSAAVSRAQSPTKLDKSKVTRMVERVKTGVDR